MARKMTSRTQEKDKSVRTSATTAERTAVTPDLRRKMIAEAAYFRAQRHGFRGGSPVEDWLVAEREIDSQIWSGQPRSTTN
jgi:hypothetical protein